MAIEFIGQAIGLKLPATQKSVLLCLANWANHDGVTYPSTARLAEVAGVSKTTAKRAIRDFLAAGIIQRHYRRGDDGKNQSNVYRLTLDNWTGDRVIGAPYRARGTPTIGPEGAGDGVMVASNTVTDTVNRTLSCHEREILDFLNKTTGRTFRQVDGVKARMSEGASMADLKLVIAYKWGQWGRSPKWREFCRPSTLFGKKNFWEYHEAAKAAGFDSQERDEWDQGPGGEDLDQTPHHEREIPGERVG